VVVLSDSEPSATLSIVLTRGALVTVHVNDTGQHLSEEGKTPGVHLLVGVPTDALFFEQAWVVSQDSTTRTYQILVPFDRSLRIVVGSAILHLADVANRTLPRLGNTIPILTPLGQAAPTIVLNITGRG